MPFKETDFSYGTEISVNAEKYIVYEPSEFTLQ